MQAEYHIVRYIIVADGTSIGLMEKCSVKTFHGDIRAEIREELIDLKDNHN